MASIPGTIGVTGEFAPKDSTDTYAICDAQYLRGASIQKADLATLQAMAEIDRLSVGQLAVTLDTGKLYRLDLIGPPNVWTELASGASNIPTVIWDGAVSFSTFYDSVNGSALTNSIQVFLSGTGHTIDNKGSIYTNIEKFSFTSFDMQRTVNIANGATIDKMPRLESGITLQSQSTSFICTNPDQIYVGEKCILKSDTSIIGVKFISLSGFAANCTIKLFDGAISGADVVSMASFANLQVEFFISSVIDATFISGVSGNLILYYVGNITIPSKSDFVNYTGSIYYSPATNANEMFNSTNVSWDGGDLWSDFYLEQDMSNLTGNLNVILKGAGHTINNKGSQYVNMDKISFVSWDTQRTINIAQGVTFNACPSSIAGVVLRSQSTSAIVTNPSSPIKVGINCELGTDAGCVFISLTGATSATCILNSGAINGNHVFDLSGTSTLNATLLNISNLVATSIYGILGTNLNLNYSSDSSVSSPSAFSNFLGAITYLPVSASSQVRGSTIQAANLAALQTFKFVGQLVVGQWGIAQDTKIAYILNSIDPLALSHTWLEPEFTNMPTTNQKGAMINANSPQASNPFLTAADGTNNSTAINNTIGQLPGANTRIYFDSAVVKAATAENNIELKTLTAAPSGSTEITFSCYATSVNSPLLLGAFQSTNITNNYYGIQAGVSVGKIWTSASDLSGTTEILQRVMRKTPCDGVITITGSGTSRTATSTVATFYPSDVNADKTLSTYLVSPKGVYRITAYTSPTVVTVEVPSGYINESNFTASRIVYVYGFTSGNILTTTNQEKTFFSDTNAEFTPATGTNWTPVDQLVIFLWGKTTVVAINKIDIVINGTTRYSHIEIPELIQIKSAARSVEPSVTYGTCRRARPISGTGSYSFDFTVPEDFRKLLSAHLVCYPTAAAAGTGRVISTSVEYNNYYGEAYNLFSASELNVIYDLTNFSDKRFHLPFTNTLVNVRAGAEGGVTVNHVAANGTINYTALEIIYI